jgi:hypothetical protein
VFSKLVEVTGNSNKILAYNKKISFTHITGAPGANFIKLFMSVIYKFSYKARVFVRLGLKSMPGTNTLAYHENS